MGTRRRSWSSDDLCIDLSYYSAGCAFPKHAHRDAFFCFVLNGHCEEDTNGRCEELQSGSLIYHPPGFEHSNQWHENGRCIHIEFAPNFCDGAKQVRFSTPAPHIIGGRACDIARSIYDELLHVDTASGIAFEGLALVLMAETIREASR
jgi:AraC family transcriptional regulator